MGKATAIVGIDTDALSFAHPAAELSEEEDKKVSLKVRHYLKSASAKGTSILLPSVTIAEYLCQYQPSEHDRVIADLEDDFLFGDFNHLAIKELALIRIEKDAAKSVRKQTGQSKQEADRPIQRRNQIGSDDRCYFSGRRRNSHLDRQ